MIVFSISICYHSAMKRIFSEEHRKKLSESHKGQKPVNLEQLRLYRLGRALDEEHKRKIAEAQIGKFVSEETRLKIGLAGKGRIPHNKGKGNEDIHCIICNTVFSAKKTHKRKFCSIGCYRKSNIKENHYKWVSNREELIGRHERNKHDPEVKQWRKSVFIRD